jgi:alkyl sulfatase BDS1-like metallo-beta-lactamase superfamily hydrolase
MLALGSTIGALLAVAQPGVAQDFDGREKLRAHSSEFRREVIRVTDGVYVAVGFDLANAIMIDGPDGRVIVDTATGLDNARAIRAAFDRISDKPIRAIIYTHHHADHTGGASAFAQGGDPEVWAHESLLPENRAENVGRGGRDGGNQFGVGLPEGVRLNAGIGPHLSAAGGNGYLPPTRTFSGARASIDVAGLRLDLVLAPGETDDQIHVWLPDRRVLMPGDNFYRAFPNLYAIRGVPLRRVDWWVTSLDALIDTRADHLVPSHTRPISGAPAVRDALTAYRDGVKSILDQTIAGMRAGQRPDELVAAVKLPPDLAANPFLQEFYGTVAWSVRAIYTYYLGWFDGNATSLFPLAFTERATRILRLAGGEANVLAQAREALTLRDFQWAAELTDYVLANDPSHRDARQLKAQALMELGERQISANARNYYLSSAQFLRQEPAVR